MIFLGASEGVVRVLREILVESFSDSHAVVVSPVSIALGDRVRLWFECDEEVKELDGAVIGAALTQMNGMLRHRLTVGGQVARRPVAEIAGRFA